MFDRRGPHPEKDRVKDGVESEYYYNAELVNKAIVAGEILFLMIKILWGNDLGRVLLRSIRHQSQRTEKLGGPYSNLSQLTLAGTI